MIATKFVHPLSPQLEDGLCFRNSAPFKARDLNVVCGNTVLLAFIMVIFLSCKSTVQFHLVIFSRLWGIERTTGIGVLIALFMLILVGESIATLLAPFHELVCPWDLLHLRPAGIGVSTLPMETIPLKTWKMEEIQNVTLNLKIKSVCDDPSRYVVDLVIDLTARRRVRLINVLHSQNRRQIRTWVSMLALYLQDLYGVPVKIRTSRVYGTFVIFAFLLWFFCLPLLF